MNRTLRTVFIGTLCLLAAASWVRAAGAGYQARLEALRKQAWDERKKQGLPDDKLFAKYPTPVVQFGRAAGVCPGAKTHLTLKGTFPPDTAFVLRSENVTVTNERLTPTQWDADVAARAGVTPEQVELEIVTPVSNATVSAPLLTIGCTHAWLLALSTGERLAVTTTWPTDGSAATATGDWSKGGKQEGLSQERVSGAGDAFDFERIVSPDDAMAQMNGLQKVMDSPEMKALDKRQGEAGKKMQACGKLPQKQQQACFTTAGNELQALVAQQQAMLKKAQAAGAPRFGCDTIRVRVRGGALEGTAEKCGAGEGRPTVSGTVRVVQ